MSNLVNITRRMLTTLGGGGGGSTLLTDLISFWSMEDTTGTTMTDDHGSNNGTTSNLTEGVTGKVGDAFDYLSQTSGYAYVPDDDTLDLGGNYTIAYWVNIQTTPSSDRVIVGKVNAGSSGWMHYVGGTTLYSFVYGPTTTNPLTLAGGSLSLGTWYHIVETYDGVNRTFYKNGSFNASAATTGSLTANTNELWIGRYFNNNSRYMDMIFDEFGLWDRVLTTDEISELYNSGSGIAYPFS